MSLPVLNFETKMVDLMCATRKVIAAHARLQAKEIVSSLLALLRPPFFFDFNCLRGLNVLLLSSFSSSLELSESCWLVETLSPRPKRIVSRANRIALAPRSFFPLVIEKIVGTFSTIAVNVSKTLIILVLGFPPELKVNREAEVMVCKSGVKTSIFFSGSLSYSDASVATAFLACWMEPSFVHRLSNLDWTSSSTALLPALVESPL
jgi:hypothetical protein